MSVFCGACGMHAQPTEDFWDNLGPNGTDQVMVLGMEINAASDSSDYQNYINNYNITHPLIDNASSFGLGYAVTYTPSTYVVYLTIHTLQFVINLATIQLGLVPLKPH